MSLCILTVVFFLGEFTITGAGTETVPISKMAVFPMDSPDPTAVQAADGSGYYTFTTGRGIRIFHSRDLIEWIAIGSVFDTSVPDWATTRIPGTRGIWAPDISYRNGLYHLYYSVSTFGGQRSSVGLTVNKTLDPKSPDYRWEDRGPVLDSIASRRVDFNAIDSAIFVDKKTDAVYLFWGSYWTGIKAAAVDPATGMLQNIEKTKMTSQPSLFIPTEYVSVAGRGQSEDTSIEAPYVIQRDDYYYLFVSWGSCCDGVRSTYRIMVGRSKDPLGPYVDKDGKKMTDGGGTLVLESDDRWKGTGHNGVLETDKGDFLILAAYDAKYPEKRRLTQLRPLTFTSDGWPQVGNILTTDVVVPNISVEF